MVIYDLSRTAARLLLLYREPGGTELATHVLMQRAGIAQEHTLIAARRELAVKGFIELAEKTNGRRTLVQLPSIGIKERITDIDINKQDLRSCLDINNNNIYITTKLDRYIGPSELEEGSNVSTGRSTNEDEEDLEHLTPTSTSRGDDDLTPTSTGRGTCRGSGTPTSTGRGPSTTPTSTGRGPIQTPTSTGRGGVLLTHTATGRGRCLEVDDSSDVDQQVSLLQELWGTWFTGSLPRTTALWFLNTCGSACQVYDAWEEVGEYTQSAGKHVGVGYVKKAIERHVSAVSNKEMVNHKSNLKKPSDFNSGDDKAEPTPEFLARLRKIQEVGLKNKMERGWEV